ncbi:Uncharacterised protein [Streptococcus pneumoniae]|nr:Uncharacterised protein [Streptococcus pneumoniae]CJD48728.1 Uncharacterised protein [Streptococcus pneumoniae]CKF35570.1 Uncharacterised protein [Streptococcus pneumoniae]
MVDKITIKPANTVKAADAQEPNFPRKSRCKVHITPVVSNAGAIKGLSSNFLMATPVISKAAKMRPRQKGKM